jgi:hypothetical protein
LRRHSNLSLQHADELCGVAPPESLGAKGGAGFSLSSRAVARPWSLNQDRHLFFNKVRQSMHHFVYVLVRERKLNVSIPPTISSFEIDKRFRRPLVIG